MQILDYMLIKKERKHKVRFNLIAGIDIWNRKIKHLFK